MGGDGKRSGSRGIRMARSQESRLDSFHSIKPADDRDWIRRQAWKNQLSLRDSG